MTEKTFELRKMNLEQVRSIYNNWMKIQFPESELKPLKHIEVMMERGIYEVIALRDGEETIAYACLGMVQDGGSILLDYYAVLPHHQNCGMGGMFLNMLKRHYAGWQAIIIEAENPDFIDDEAGNAIAVRRLGFYSRSGCVETGVLENLFGVEFRIFVLPIDKQLSDQEAYEALADIYHGFLPDEVFNEKVHIRYA